eukprot:4217646-Amphidinium_carterae.1
MVARTLASKVAAGKRPKVWLRTKKLTSSSSDYEVQQSMSPTLQPRGIRIHPWTMGIRPHDPT